MKSHPAVLRIVATSDAVDAPRAAAAARDDRLAGLAASAINGQPAAVRTFLVAIGPHLLRVVRQVLGPTSPDIDDVAQECAYQVMDALPRFRGDSTVLHFVCRVAVLTAMNARRQAAAQKRPSERDDSMLVEELSGGSPGPEASLAAAMSARAVRDLLTTLPSPQAEALALHTILGYSVAEIASDTGVAIETVRSRLRLAKKAAREELMKNPRIRELLEDRS